MSFFSRFRLYRYRIIWIFLLLCAVAVKGPHPGAQTLTDSAVNSDSIENVIYKDGVAYQELMWDALIPEAYTAEEIMAKYDAELAKIEEGPDMAKQVQRLADALLNNAPVNDKLDGAFVKLPGFIAPLEFSDEVITEFLLVPYFGACVHVPPPPANQTVLVKTVEGHGIEADDAYDPVWIMGELTTERATTDLAEAGYYMADALTEPYSE